MPTNLITARSVVHVPYANPDVAHPHIFKFYLDCACIATDGIISLDGVTNPDTSADWLLKDIILNIVARNGTHRPLTWGQMSVGVPWVYQNETGGETETFIGFDLSDYSGTSAVGSEGIAAAQRTWTFQSADRSNYRFTFSDMAFAIPTREPVVSPPDVDDDTFEWFVIKSNVPFATNDGERLVRPINVNYGVNDKLARTYGKDHNVVFLP